LLAQLAHDGRAIVAGVDAGFAGADDADDVGLAGCSTRCQSLRSGVTTSAILFFAAYPFCGGSTPSRAMKRICSSSP
jgi:hypothetical protein